MIRLSCTRCGTLLSVDDGFAGGVCRCSKCGTIQTVPSCEQSAKTTVAGRAIFEKKYGSGSPDLDSLSEIVSSSGLGGQAGSGLASSNRRHRRRERPWLLPLTLVAGGILVAGGVGLGLLLAGGSASREIGDAAGGSRSTTPPVVPTAVVPAFADIPLRGTGPVVYLIDRGDATRDALPTLIDLALRSAATIGPGRRFQIRFWDSNGQSPAFPAEPALATPSQIASVRAELASLSRGGVTTLRPALEAALAKRPGEIVLVTGKDLTFDDTFAPDVRSMLAGRSTLVHTAALQHPGVDDPNPLKQVAQATGGTFIVLEP